MEKQIETILKHIIKYAKDNRKSNVKIQDEIQKIKLELVKLQGVDKSIFQSLEYTKEIVVEHAKTIDLKIINEVAKCLTELKKEDDKTKKEVNIKEAEIVEKTKDRKQDWKKFVIGTIIGLITGLLALLIKAIK